MIAEYNVNLENKTKSELILFIKELQNMLKEKDKELLEKIKQIPDDAIEGAIDSLYTEYIKEAKEYIEHEIKNNKLLNGYTDIYIFQTEVELLLKYIQHLEQKESILDKVTEECRKQMKEYEDSILEIFPQNILKIIEGEKK